MGGDFADSAEFLKLAAGREDVDLVELMLEISADRYPDLDRSSCRKEIARLGERARDAIARLPNPRPLRRRLDCISRVLYREEGFRGNDEHYYDPRNSYLNDVLERRTGIPITMCIVYRAVAEAAGVPMYGVGTPGHFVLGCGDKGRRLYVDAFCSGVVLDWQQCRDEIETRLGQRGTLTKQDFRAATSAEIAARVLRNLKAVYASENEWAAALPVQRRLALLLPDVASEGRDLGLILLRLGDPKGAARQFDGYLKVCSDEEGETMQPFVRNARRMIAEMN
jgi:regulator of sirC expression with transglutaminase-like and TPR domain